MMSSPQAERPAGSWGGDSPYGDAAFRARRFAPAAPGPLRWTIHGHYDPRSAGGTSTSRSYGAPQGARVSDRKEMRSGVVARRRWIMKTLRHAALRRPSSMR